MVLCNTNLDHERAVKPSDNLRTELKSNNCACILFLLSDLLAFISQISLTEKIKAIQ